MNVVIEKGIDGCWYILPHDTDHEYAPGWLAGRFLTAKGAEIHAANEGWTVIDASA